MIIPIGHDQSVRRWPWATLVIIAICTGIQIYSVAFAPTERDFQKLVARAPQEDTPENRAAFTREVEALVQKVPVARWGYRTGSGVTEELVTCAFVHAGWFHLIGNMLFLFLVGAALEDRWGPVKWVAFYLVSAAAATYGFNAAYHGPPTICVGASGAISAGMGAFLVLFSTTRINFWYYWFFRTGTFTARAYLALPIWFLEQVLWSYLSSDATRVSGTAYSAHITGFLFGAVVAFATSRLFPEKHDAAEASEPEDEPATPAAPANDRYNQCVAAIAARDIANIRVLSSRVILDLAREGKHSQIIDLYRAITKQLTHMPLTDGAFVAAAAAADALGDYRVYAAVAAAFSEEQPRSSQLPQVLWRLAEIHRATGATELEAEALHTLATRFPHDPFGAHAAEALKGHR